MGVLKLVLVRIPYELQDGRHGYFHMSSIKFCVYPRVRKGVSIRFSDGA